MKWDPYLKPHKNKSSFNINVIQSALHMHRFFNYEVIHTNMDEKYCKKFQSFKVVNIEFDLQSLLYMSSLLY